MTREFLILLLLTALSLMVTVAILDLMLWYIFVYVVKKAGFLITVGTEPCMLPPRSVVKLQGNRLPRCGYREIKSNLWPMYAGVIVERNTETNELTLWSTYTWPIRWLEELELWYWWRVLILPRKGDSGGNVSHSAYHLRLGGITKKDQT